MSFRTISSMAFALSTRIVADHLTELYLFDRDLVESRDPDGLTPVNGKRVLGLPTKLVTTAEGVAAYLGKPEEARKALLAAGMIEAPVTVLPDNTIAYATRDTSEGIRPNARLLFAWRDGRLFFLSRYPASEDLYLGQSDLPEQIQTHFPPFEGSEGFACVQDQALVTAWLEQVVKIEKDV